MIQLLTTFCHCSPLLMTDTCAHTQSFIFLKCSAYCVVLMISGMKLRCMSGSHSDCIYIHSFFSFFAPAALYRMIEH